MVGLSGLEKFSHLEDKIYRTIELTKSYDRKKRTSKKNSQSSIATWEMF